MATPRILIKNGHMGKRLDEAKRELERAGYEVKRKVVWIKHSFQVDEKRLKEFQGVVSERHLYMKDALDQALAEWIAKNLKSPG